MKYTFFRMIAVLLSCVLLAAMLAGCDSDTDDASGVAEEATPEYAFVPEFTSLSALAVDLPNMSNIIIANNKLFFTSTSDIESDALFRRTHIYTLDLDDFDLAYLPNYTAPSSPPEAEGGGVHVNAMHVDADGKFWVVEEGGFVEFDFPPGFDLEEAESDEIWEHVSSREWSHNLRKLDSTGAELKSININHLWTDSDFIGIFSFHVDEDENIFLGSDRTIFVLNSDGETLFSLDTDDFILPESFISLSDGRTAFYNLFSTGTALALRAIDVQSQTWGASINLPANIHNVFAGFEENLVLINDGINLSGINIDTGEILPIINWMDSVGVPMGLGNITFLPGERIMFTTTTLEHDGESISHTELITLNRTPRGELPEKITLTMVATWLPSEIIGAIAEFNRTSASYKIEVNTINLSPHTSSDDLTRLALEITTGGGSDIFVLGDDSLGALPFNQWAAQGLFVDLYELIDEDPIVNRDDILDVVLRSAETNGRLYQIIPGFTISTMTGNPDVLGSEPGWTFGELIAVLEANPQATKAFGVSRDGMSFFQYIYLNHVDNFVNWETGTVDFDNDEFVEFLEFAYELRRVFSWWGDNRNDDGIITFTFSSGMLSDWISSGETIAEVWPVSTFNDPIIISRFFGEDFVFKGYPTDSGSGNFLGASTRFAISTMSENQEGAWAFLRLILSEQWQERNVTFEFPTNRMAFENRLDRARSGNETAVWSGYILYPNQLPNDTSAYVDITLALIESVDGLPPGFDPLLDIVFEGIDDMFAGRATAQDAARIIQSRASVYVAEQS